MNPSPSTIQSILKSGLIIAGLDAMAAWIHSMIFGSGNFFAIWRFVASGAFGKASFEGGWPMVLLGLLFHIMVATGWTALFYFLVPRLNWLSGNRFLVGIGYGVFIYVMMNFAVIPLSQIPAVPFRFTVSRVAMIAIHMFVIGVPISYLAGQYFGKR